MRSSVDTAKRKTFLSDSNKTKLRNEDEGKEEEKFPRDKFLLLFSSFHSAVVEEKEIDVCGPPN